MSLIGNSSNVISRADKHTHRQSLSPDWSKSLLFFISASLSSGVLFFPGFIAIWKGRREKKKKGRLWFLFDLLRRSIESMPMRMETRWAACSYWELSSWKRWKKRRRWRPPMSNRGRRRPCCPSVTTSSTEVPTDPPCWNKSCRQYLRLSGRPSCRPSSK